MSKTLVIGVVVAVVGLFALGGFLLWQQSQPSWPPEDVVQDPNGAGWVYTNRLTILGSREDIEEVVREFGGEIVSSVPETDTHEIEFPVSSLGELGQIKEQLNQRGVQAMDSIVLEPPDCSKGPC